VVTTAFSTGSAPRSADGRRDQLAALTWPLRTIRLGRCVEQRRSSFMGDRLPDVRDLDVAEPRPAAPAPASAIAPGSVSLPE